MKLSFHDYDKLYGIENIDISLATFGHVKYIKVSVDDVVVLYDLDLRLAVATVLNKTKLRYVNSFLERNRTEVMKKLSDRYGQNLSPTKQPKNFISTDKAVLGVSQMKHQLIFALGTDLIDFFYDMVTKKYHIYLSNGGYCEAYSDKLDLEHNDKVTENQYRVIKNLLSYMVVNLRNTYPVTLTVNNKDYTTINVSLRSEKLDMRWITRDNDITHNTYFGIISDEEYMDYHKAVLGFTDMIYETGIYGLIEEMNRL